MPPVLTAPVVPGGANHSGRFRRYDPLCTSGLNVFRAILVLGFVLLAALRVSIFLDLKVFQNNGNSDFWREFLKLWTDAKYNLKQKNCWQNT